jgi:hypothetical protein
VAIRDPARAWVYLSAIVFVVVSARQMLAGFLLPVAFGSHAAIYTDAARAWLGGDDPWRVGPPLAIFAGPPPMLLLFIPFVSLPVDLNRWLWVVGSLLLAVWMIRRIRLPACYLAFPPIFQSIFLGHPEVLMLWLVLFAGPAAGIAAAIKPYLVFPLLAERNSKALLVSGIAVLVTAPFLPWQRFIDELPVIAENLERQSQGDSVINDPLLVVIALVALASFGLRRGLWLAGPVLWPAAQPIYKTVTTPALSPFLAIMWAIPVPGFTLLGVVIEGVTVRVAQRTPLPEWLMAGFRLAAADGPLNHELPASSASP